MEVVVKLAVAAAVVCLLAPAVVGGRVPADYGQELAARTEGEGGMGECLSALYELRSCSNEIILFFLSGDSYLTSDCCRAIRLITRTCWPALLTSVGYTAEEADILSGYCDAGGAVPPPPPPGASPAVPPLPPASDAGLA